ncbi:MAG TPA: response regulator transcription factor [Burkholderiales bacterium]
MATQNNPLAPPDTPDTHIRVLIADDHAVVREGLAAMINRQPDMRVVAEAPDGMEAVRQWSEQRPDVALVDLRMPRLDGVGFISQVRTLDPKARILILTTFDGDEDIYRGMRAGAKAYLLKDAPREQLLDCIRAVHAGDTFLPPNVAAKLAAQVSEERLTDREQEILKLIAAGDSNKAIARKLNISEGTVKTHVKSVLFKLGATSRTEAAAIAARRGLVQR